MVLRVVILFAISNNPYYSTTKPVPSHMAGARYCVNFQRHTLGQQQNKDEATYHTNNDGENEWERWAMSCDDHASCGTSGYTEKCSELKKNSQCQPWFHQVRGR